MATLKPAGEEKFNRQKPLGNYIVDFYCKPLQLVIEVDGSYHFEQAQRIKDKEWQTVLEDRGLHFLRFEEIKVRMDMDVVLQTIYRFALDYEQAHPEALFRRRQP